MAPQWWARGGSVGQGCEQMGDVGTRQGVQRCSAFSKFSWALGMGFWIRPGRATPRKELWGAVCPQPGGGREGGSPLSGWVAGLLVDLSLWGH